MPFSIIPKKHASCILSQRMQWNRTIIGTNCLCKVKQVIMYSAQEKVYIVKESLLWGFCVSCQHHGWGVPVTDNGDLGLTALEETSPNITSFTWQPNYFPSLGTCVTFFLDTAISAKLCTEAVLRWLNITYVHVWHSVTLFQMIIIISVQNLKFCLYMYRT